jgi:hypothetical protein
MRIAVLPPGDRPGAEHLHEVSPVHSRAAFGHLRDALARQGFHRHEHVGSAFSLVLAVLFGHLPRLGRQRLTHFANQLLAAFVHADHRPFRIIRAMIDL